MSTTPSRWGRLTLAALVMALVGGLLAAPASAKDGPKPVELQILALNDFHGNINTLSTSFGGTGGAQNLATNIAAVGWFAWTGNLPYQYAVPMAAANIAGSFLGARMAILKGSDFIRKFLLCVVLVLIMRFAYELAFPR